jgi:hypothetical protein
LPREEEGDDSESTPYNLGDPKQAYFWDVRRVAEEIVGSGLANDETLEDLQEAAYSCGDCGGLPRPPEEVLEFSDSTDFAHEYASDYCDSCQSGREGADGCWIPECESGPSGCRDYLMQNLAQVAYAEDIYQEVLALWCCSCPSLRARVATVDYRYWQERRKKWAARPQ